MLTLITPVENMSYYRGDGMIFIWDGKAPIIL